MLARSAATFARGDSIGARSIVDEVLAAAPDHIVARSRRAAIQAAIDAEEQQRAHERLASDAVSTARQRFDAGEHAAAIHLLDAFAPPHPATTAALVELRGRLAEIERSRQEAERQQLEAERQREEAVRQRQAAVRDATAQARSALERQAFGDAIRALDDALALDPETPARAKLRARAVAGAEEARRHAEHERLAREAVSAAEKLAAASDEAGAVALLEHFEPSHPLVADALLEMRRRAIAKEEHLRAARQQRIDETFRIAREEIAAGTFQPAIERLQLLERTEEPIDGLDHLIEQARAQQAAAERERARNEAEARRREFERGIRSQIAMAQAHLDRDEPGPALNLCEAALKQIAGADGVTELAQEIKGTIAIARRRLQVQSLIDAAVESRNRNALTEALAKVDAALAIDPAAARALALQTQIRTAIEANKREEIERVKRSRKAAAEQRERERYEQVTAALARARTTASARDAVLILNGALALDPDNKACLDLLSARRAELMAAARRLIDGGQVEDARRAIDDMEQLGIAPADLATLYDLAAAAEAAAVSALAARDHVRDDLDDAPASAVDRPRRAAESVIVTMPPAPAPTPTPTPINWTVIGGATAALVLVATLVLFVTRRGGETPPPNDVSSAASTVVTTIPATTSIGEPPPRPPTSVPPTPTVDVPRIVASVRALIRQRDFAGAARTATDGLKLTPNDAALAGAMREALDAAAVDADTARKAADRAGAESRLPYRQAVGLVISANRLRQQAGREQRAITEYGTAARLFADAAREPERIVASTPTTVPPTQPPPVTAVSTVPPTVISSVTTTSIPPTTSIVPSIDASDVQALLRQYAAAYGSFNLAAIRRVFPGFPPLLQNRVDSQRKTFRSCDYSFTNINILTSSAAAAHIEVDTVETCRPTTAQRDVVQRYSSAFDLTRTPNGWIIARHLF
jgi:hypothetical protein